MAILRVFVPCHVPFLVPQSPAFLDILKSKRPADVARKSMPTRWQLAGPRLAGLYNEMYNRVSRILFFWCERRKAVLVLGA